MLTKEYEHSTEDFIEHFKRTYTEPFPPAWILGELLPMGSVNMYYRNLKDKGLKKQIAKRFSLHAPVFESWLSVLTLTRNACCHHARVWNKVNKIIPNDMRGMARPWITLPTDKRRIYYNMCIIKYFLDIISPNNDMLAKMHNLFSKFPEIPGGSWISFWLGTRTAMDTGKQLNANELIAKLQELLLLLTEDYLEPCRSMLCPV